MSINFIPNDPLSVAQFPSRLITPRADRPADRARCDVAGAVTEGAYANGTADFLYWQCREAVLAALEAWEAVDGPLASWQESDVLAVFPDDGVELNAYYTRDDGRPERISFSHQAVGNTVYYAGASTDVVAHEAGHALLDTVRPDFWDSNRFEVNAFHEAFGDCMAIVTALHDADTRAAVLPTIAVKNGVEATAEELAAAIRRFSPTHNAGVARRARNTFQWGPQGSLPYSGGPGVLVYEVHSFGQVFSGCFYDTVVNIFKGMAPQSEAQLLGAVQTAARLLVKATRQAPQRAQYFREIGRYMVLIDEQDNAAANRDAIRDAFLAHNVALGSSLTLAPQAVLEPVKPSATATGAVPSMRPSAVTRPATLPPAARRTLLNLIGAETGSLAVRAVERAGTGLQEAVHTRAVPLDAVSKNLRGVVALADQVSLVGRSGAALSIMGHVSNAGTTVRDVETYVQSLVRHKQIRYTPPRVRRAARGVAGDVAPVPMLPGGVTHDVRDVNGQKTLVRVRFACRGH